MPEFEALDAIRIHFDAANRELDQLREYVQRVDERERANHSSSVAQREEIKKAVLVLEGKVQALKDIVTGNKNLAYWLGGAAILGGALASGKIDTLLGMFKK